MEEGTIARSGRQAVRYGQGQQRRASGAMMAQGTIKSLVSNGGWGLILPEEASAMGQEIYFHRADMAGNEPWNILSYDDLQVGQRVEYDLGRDERSGAPRATNVQSLPWRPAASANGPSHPQDTTLPLTMGEPLSRSQTLALMAIERQAYEDRAAHALSLQD